MNKNQIVMCATGGVALVASLVVGFFAYSALEEQGERSDDLETAKQSVERINKSKIAPDQASVDAFAANRSVLRTWTDESLALASMGDMAAERGVTPASFKQRMVDDAREMSRLPGFGGPIVKDGFGFGFKDIITGGSMPDPSRMDSLQRQWSEVKAIVGVLSASGVTELTSVTVVEKAPEPAPDPRGRKPNRAGEEEQKKESVSAQSYELRFLARPAALVRTLNALAASQRFTTVDDFSFSHPDDALAGVLGGGKDKQEAGRKPRRQRRGLEQADQSEKPEDAAKKGLVTDPASAAPFAVTLALTTYDFGSKAEGAAAEESKEGQE